MVDGTACESPIAGVFVGVFARSSEIERKFVLMVGMARFCIVITGAEELVFAFFRERALASTDDAFGGDFDFITGSTVTSRATVIATRDALKTLNEIDLDSLPKCKVR